MFRLWGGAVVVALTACHALEAPGRPPAGAQPFANAGTGSSYPLGATVTLDGTTSFDPDGQIVAYRWSVLARPAGSTAVPGDPASDTTSFMPDLLGTYRLQLAVDDDAQNTDLSELRIVATGAITSLDAGPDATVPWLRTAQLSGTETTLAGFAATYAWTFVARPARSNATLEGGTTRTPTFAADAVGTYVLAFGVHVGDEVREDTVTVEVTGGGVALGTGTRAYTYSSATDRIVYAHDVGHAEVVQVDPQTGDRLALDIGAFTPRSIGIDPNHGVVAVGGAGQVASVALVQFERLSLQAAPGCTARQVQIPFSSRIDCFPEDGTIEPITSVYMPTGEVTQIPCPVRFPDVALSPNGFMYMVDGASSRFLRLDAYGTPPLAVTISASLPGITPPVIAAGMSQPFAVTGNGFGVNPDGTLRFDLQTPVSAGVFSGLQYELAIVSGAQLKVFGLEAGQPLKLTAALPEVDGMLPTARLVAYSADEHRLIIVAGTAAGDVAYTVPR